MSLNAASQTETGPFPPVAWVNGKSHIPTMTQTTIPGWSSVLHLKAYLTFHSSIHSPWAVRLWAWPRLAFGRQCSELKATHGPSLVLWVTKHTSRARNSWPVFLTKEEKLGIWDKYGAADLGSEPGQTKVLSDETRQMVSSLTYQTLVSAVSAQVEGNTLILKCCNIELYNFISTF